MDDPSAFSRMLTELKRLNEGLTDVLDYQRLQRQNASDLGDGDDDDDDFMKRLGIERTLGGLEFIEAVRATVIRARDTERLPFSRVVGALESSYLTLEMEQARKHDAQQYAFEMALRGHSRAAYDSAAIDFQRILGKTSEVSRLLHFARSLLD